VKEEMNTKFLKQVFTEYIPSAESCLQWKKLGKEGNSHHWYHVSNPNKKELKNGKIRLVFPPPNVISMCQSKDHRTSETMKTQER